MSNPYQHIKGHERILNAFGYWPSFHDSEIRSVLLDRSSVLFEEVADTRLDVCLHAFEWTRNTQPAFNHHLVQLRFHEINDVNINGFNHQNAIMEFKIEDHVQHPDAAVGLKLTFVPANGLSGSFCAASAEVLSVIPCDDAGRPRHNAEP